MTDDSRPSRSVLGLGLGFAVGVGLALTIPLATATPACGDFHDVVPMTLELVDVIDVETHDLANDERERWSLEGLITPGLDRGTELEAYRVETLSVWETSP